MEKPLVISIGEFNEALAQLINTYLKEVPATVLLNSVTDIERFLAERADREYSQAKKEYEESEVNSNG